MKKNPNMFYDKDVDYDALEQHMYDDAPGAIFYTCPICGGEYLSTFITSDDCRTMCIDCWAKRHNQ
ncbi:MAG: hypothetical protein HFF75_09370 [Oscillospiraceae bacterium]|nr:hypothetical protein [Oscillospiraceae bacterium]